MILPFDDEEEGLRPQVSEPQVTLDVLTPVAPASRMTPTSAEKEEVEVLVEELEKYFFSPHSTKLPHPLPGTYR